MAPELYGGSPGPRGPWSRAAGTADTLLEAFAGRRAERLAWTRRLPPGLGEASSPRACQQPFLPPWRTESWIQGLF